MKRSSPVSFSIGFALLSFVVVLNAAPVLASSVKGAFQRSYTVTGPVDLEAMTRSGDISISGGPAGKVTVSGKIYVEDHRWWQDGTAVISRIEQTPPIHQSGNHIDIDDIDVEGSTVPANQADRSYLDSRGIFVSYEITIPDDSAIHTESGSGDQSVKDMHGTIELRSGSGDMRVCNTGSVRIATGSGDLLTRNLSGTFNAETGSGDIAVESSQLTDAQISTGSGDIRLRAVKGALRVSSASGDVKVEGEPEAWRIHTASGNIELEIPEAAAFDIEAETSSGEIETGRPIIANVQGSVGGSSSRISGKVNGGGSSVQLHTTSGDIRIH